MTWKPCDYTGLPIPGPVPITFASWATEWMAQKKARCRAGKKPRPSTLHSWQSGMLQANPVRNLDWQELLGPEEHYHRRYRDLPLTPVHLLYFFDVAKTKYTPKGYHEPAGPYYPLLEVAAWTGLRLGELIGLRWGDVDLTSTPSALSVRGSSYKGVDGPPKSRAGRRAVLLIERVLQMLRCYRAQCFGVSMAQGWQEHLLFQLAMAHEQGLLDLGSGFFSVSETLALAVAWGQCKDGRTFWDAGDATPNNVHQQVKAHFLRVALTRAKARVLRDTLNIGMVCVEELEE